LVVTRRRRTVVVTARGVLDADGSEQLRWLMEDLMDNQGNLAVTVDLSGVTTLDSSAMDALDDVAHRAAQRGGELTVTGARPAAPGTPRRIRR
jgi:anti-anti-sigma factor